MEHGRLSTGLFRLELPNNGSCIFDNSTDTWRRLQQLEHSMKMADYSTFYSTGYCIFPELVIAFVGICLNVMLAGLLIMLRLRKAKLLRHHFLLLSMVCMDILTTAILFVYSSHGAYDRFSHNFRMHRQPQLYKRAMVTTYLTDERLFTLNLTGLAEESDYDNASYADGLDSFPEQIPAVDTPFDWLFEPRMRRHRCRKKGRGPSHGRGRRTGREFLNMLYLSLRLMPVGPAVHYMALSILQAYSVINPIGYIRRVRHGFCKKLSLFIWICCLVLWSVGIGVTRRSPGLGVAMLLNNGLDFAKETLIPTTIICCILSSVTFGVFMVVVVVSNGLTIIALKTNKVEMTRSKKVSFKIVRIQIVIYVGASLLIFLCTVLQTQTIIDTVHFVTDNCCELFNTWMVNVTSLFYYATLLEVSPLFWFLRACIEPVLVFIGNDELRKLIKSGWQERTTSIRRLLSRSSSLQLFPSTLESRRSVSVPVGIS